MAIMACLHPNQTPLTLIAWVKSQILSSVLTASSSLSSELSLGTDSVKCDILSVHDTSVVELLSAPESTQRRLTYHNIKSSPFSDSSLYQLLDIGLGRDITLDRLTFRGWVLLCNVLCSLLGGRFVDIGDVKECSF